MDAQQVVAYVVSNCHDGLKQAKLCTATIIIFCVRAMTSTTVLQTSLERHNGTFESLLKLIPAKYYLVQDPDELASKFQKHTKKEKEHKKEALKKAKRDKVRYEFVLEIVFSNRCIV